MKHWIDMFGQKRRHISLAPMVDVDVSDRRIYNAMIQDSACAPEEWVPFDMWVRSRTIFLQGGRRFGKTLRRSEFVATAPEGLQIKAERV